MAIPRSLGNELFRYRRRKRRSLDGSVPGLPQERFHRSRRYVSGIPYIPRPGGSHHDLYNWGLPGEYHPRVHAPAVQLDEYFNDPDWESHDVPLSHQDKLLRPFPEPEPVERPFDYEHAQAMNEFFLNALDVQYQHFEEGQEVPSLADIWGGHTADSLGSNLESDIDADSPADALPADEIPSEPVGLPDVEEMTEALTQLRQVLPEDHPDILRLQTAIEMVSYHGVTPDATEAQTDPSYAVADPMDNAYDQDASEHQEAAFEQHARALEDMMGAPEFASGPSIPMEMPVEPVMGLEATLGEPTPPEDYDQSSGLEQLVEQEDPFAAAPPMPMEQGMMPEAMEPDIGAPGIEQAVGFEGMTPEDEINQAMDAITGPLGPEEMEPEPDPFQMQQDPFATAQQIFEEQMQHMHNPFMMPGMGPMGPMPGPAPGM